MAQYGSWEHRWDPQERGRREERWGEGSRRGGEESREWEREDELPARGEWEEYPRFGPAHPPEWRREEHRRFGGSGEGRGGGGRDWDRPYGARSGGAYGGGMPRGRAYGGTYGSSAYGPGGYEPGRERWGESWRPEEREHRRMDRPWVEPSPERREWGERRGMYEWEDRGPIKWLGDKIREATGGKPRGPKGYTRSDEAISDAVCERIARSGVDASDVEVKVEKREVTLTGTVPSRTDKWRLEEIVEDVYGVEDVENHLRVKRHEERRTEPGSLEDPSLRH